MTTPGWYRRARRFILEQKQKELLKSIGRYPNSDQLPRRKSELAEIEEELSQLSE